MRYGHPQPPRCVKQAPHPHHLSTKPPQSQRHLFSAKPNATIILRTRNPLKQTFTPITLSTQLDLYIGVLLCITASQTPRSAHLKSLYSHLTSSVQNPPRVNPVCTSPWISTLQPPCISPLTQYLSGACWDITRVGQTATKPKNIFQHFCNSNLLRKNYHVR